MATLDLQDVYRFWTEWSDEDQEWVGRCDAFPFMNWLEPDRAAAETGIRSVVGEAIEILKSEGQPLQPPSGPADNQP